MYKCVNNLAPPISRDTFIPRQNPHNIRNFREFCSFNNYTVKYGTETVLYRAPQLWQQLPQEIKESKTLWSYVADIIRLINLMRRKTTIVGAYI